MKTLKNSFTKLYLHLGPPYNIVVVERLSIHLTDLYRLTVSTSTLHYSSGQRTKYGCSSSSKECRLSDRESHHVRKLPPTCKGLQVPADLTTATTSVFCPLTRQIV